MTAGGQRAPLLRGLGLGVLFLGATLVETFPHVTRLRTHTPGDYGDAYFYQWLLRWDVHALLTSPADVFNTNIFWPARDTLAYSDTLLPVAPLAGVLRALVGSVLAFNLLYLGTWMASLAMVYVLARRITGDAVGSVLAAFVFTFAAVRLQHYVHFQLLFAALVPLAVWLLLRFLDERAWWQAVGLGATLATSVLVTAYSALMIGIALAVMTLTWLPGRRFRPGPRLAPGLLVAALVAAVLSGPALWQYLRYGDLIEREYQHHVAVHPGDLLAPAIGNYLYGPLDEEATRDGRNGEHRLFPGIGALTLAAAGAVFLARRREAGGRRRELTLVLAASAVLFVLAFGRYQRIAGVKVPLPYAALINLGVPGFDSVRALGRFMVFPLLGLALLAGFGFSRLAAAWPRLRLAAGVLVGGFLLLEFAGPIQVVPSAETAEFTAVNVALSKLPPGPVVELPMADGRYPFAPLIEPARMVASSIDWRPRVNGASAYVPANHQGVVMVLNTLGAPASDPAPAIDRLDQLGVRYVVVRMAPVTRALDVPGVTHFDEDQAARVVAALGGRAGPVTREGSSLLIPLRSR